MKKNLIIGGVVAGCLLLLAVLMLTTIVAFRNGLIMRRELVNGAWSQVENQLKRRTDLIPNLVNTVKGFAAHEQEAISAVTEARARLGGAGQLPVSERAQVEAELSGALSRLLMVVENYPNLKADATFRQLADELAGTENRIAVARRDYNQQVQNFNTVIMQFPGSLFGMEKSSYYEISDRDRQNPEVSF